MQSKKVIVLKQNKKIGIMGGTFNPIHLGHLLLAEEAKTQVGLDEILFMPSGCSYMKEESSILSAKERIKMTALAIEDNPSFSLSTLETEREGATYTYETLMLLKEQNPQNEYYFILGADNLFSIEKWKNPQLIFENCILIAAVRGDKDIIQVKEKADLLTEKFGAKVILLSERMVDISSTEIRERIKQGLSVRYMIPQKVFSYIEKYKLYQ